MLRGFSILAALASANTSVAGFDPEYSCLSPGTDIDLVISGVRTKLAAETPITVIFGHRMNEGFFPAWIRMKKSRYVRGFSHSVVGTPTNEDESPMDRIVRTQSNVVWIHSGGGTFEPPKELILNCDAIGGGSN
ncbi:hypothetical protein [Ruegeria hyattellae]|jgi:hypothetical protein|uniref:hypothetical protein n=1 Tax=Ruegeria hyattellae TaxID=3233337 RepID=UPI00355BBA6D